MMERNLLPKTSGCRILGFRERRGILVRVMWNSSRREDEDSTPSKETTPSVFKSTPAATETPLGDRVQSHETTILGKSLVVKGEISGNEALVVDGRVEGPITLHGQRLTVRPNGFIHGDIEARHVILLGQVEGDIQASERVELFRSGSFTGNISTARISIEEGARFNGRLDIKKPEITLITETKPGPAGAISVASTSQQVSLLEGPARKSGTG
jgi:cytoskeletal protein CcmA (bactofilin family)